ncbi:ester cyclase [Streptomyces diastatochromogenes]|uniref:Polyketide cyclase n=1 Tax=Streptomyces diastatochromogenes TaxID=42236 RepID=A0A233S9Y9_STRDA|nr:ester cyclase [Streptomyces diastatochromogenes]MCZ0991051.1 ester cyclase [Streptomyces diastatochromogenes]OXY92289.1 polyketide cyclase [Streptomyces diastatochromogenes]
MSRLTVDVRERREKVVRDHFEDEVRHAWDDVLSTFPHPRYELIPMGVVHDGDAEVRGYYHDTRVAFPDQRHEMISLRHADDAVVVEFYLLGTHRGPFGAIPATGNTFKVRVTAFFVFEDDRLVCERIYFDTLTILKQLIGGLDFKKPSTLLLMLRILRALPSSLGNKGKPNDAVHTISEV